MIKTRESLSVSQIFGEATSQVARPPVRPALPKPTPSLQARIALVLGMIAICASLGVLVGNAMRSRTGSAEIQATLPGNDPAS